MDLNGISTKWNGTHYGNFDTFSYIYICIPFHARKKQQTRIILSSSVHYINPVQCDMALRCGKTGSVPGQCKYILIRSLGLKGQLLFMCGSFDIQSFPIRCDNLVIRALTSCVAYPPPTLPPLLDESNHRVTSEILALTDQLQVRSRLRAIHDP